MKIIDDVVSIKQELEQIKEENQKRNIKSQEIKKIEKANKKLLEALIMAIFAFIFLLVYSILIKY